MGERIKLKSVRGWAAITGVIFGGFLCSARPATALSAAVPMTVPVDIPVGTADENLQTSRALVAIMQHSIQAYASTDHMHAEGTYVAASKSEDEETSYLEARVVMDYHRPGKMAIISKSKSPSLNRSFIADGTTVTMVDAEGFKEMAQPDSLSAFTDFYRAGEIYEDKSGAIAMTFAGPMLTAENAAGILLEKIEQYIYEGEEQVAGADCHRMRFIQNDPDMVVILWFDKTTWLIRKASFISSYDENFTMVESFEDGVNSSLLVMTWDEISTDTAKIPDGAFALAAVVSKKKTEAPEKTRKIRRRAPGLWESLVSSAAEASPEATTWSLTGDSDDVNLRITRFAQLPESILDFVPAPTPDGGQPRLAVATKGGVITLHKPNGSVDTTVTLPGTIADFELLDVATSEPLILATNESGKNLSAYNLKGELAWTYSYPTQGIRHMAVTTGTVPAIYLTLSGLAGLRKLDENGNVLFANVSSYFTGSPHPAPAPVDRLLYNSSYEIAVMDKNLALIGAFDTDERVRSLQWDPENADAPVLTIAESTDDDILLQRRDENGNIVWTTMIAPKAEAVSGSGLELVRLRIGGQTQRCIFVLLSDGQAVITNTEGKVLYRGQVSANAALVKRNDDDVLQNIAIADLNQDGIHEIYTKIDKHILQLTTP